MNKITGIGSLPHTCITSAVTYSMKHDLPFLPQLTSLNERMITQAIESGNIEKNHKALYPFIESLLNQNSTKFKIQIAGPTTCAVSDKEILKTIEAFLKIFQNHRLEPIVFIDEPVLSGSNSMLVKIIKELSYQNIKNGVHTCNTFDWSQIEKLETNFLSYDFQLNGQGNYNKKIILGCDPNKMVNVENFGRLKFDYLSFTCGLAGFNESFCESIYIFLRSLK